VAIPDTLSGYRSSAAALRWNYHLQLTTAQWGIARRSWAVEGIGGLGHLGDSFAQKFGYKFAAIGRGSESASLAKNWSERLH